MTTATHTVIACRLAYPDEGPLVKALFTKFYQQPCEWLRWDTVFPHWIIAEVNGVPSGMAMMGVGCPFGWLEMLLIDPALPATTRGRVVLAIEAYAYDALKAFGVSGVLCTIGEDNATFHQYVARQGYVKQGDGTVYLKRLL